MEASMSGVGGVGGPKDPDGSGTLSPSKMIRGRLDGREVYKDNPGKTGTVVQRILGAAFATKPKKAGPIVMEGLLEKFDKINRDNWFEIKVGTERYHIWKNQWGGISIESLDEKKKVTVSKDGEKLHKGSDPKGVPIKGLKEDDPSLKMFKEVAEEAVKRIRFFGHASKRMADDIG
jgi:hypothetical protein